MARLIQLCLILWLGQSGFRVLLWFFRCLIYVDLWNITCQALYCSFPSWMPFQHGEVNTLLVLHFMDFDERLLTYSALWILCWQQKHWSLQFLSRQFCVGLPDQDCCVAFTGQIERNFLSWCLAFFLHPTPTLHAQLIWSSLLVLFCYYDGISVLYLHGASVKLEMSILLVWEPLLLIRSIGKNKVNEQGIHGFTFHYVSE